MSVPLQEVVWQQQQSRGVVFPSHLAVSALLSSTCPVGSLPTQHTASHMHATRMSSPQGHEQRLLKDLALSREQLKRDLAASKQELELVAGAADAAKEEAAAQINLLSQQLAAAQQRLGEAEKVRVKGQSRGGVSRRPEAGMASLQQDPTVRCDGDL